MVQYVRETAAGRSISAWVILKGSREVATVQSHYSNGGRVLVNVWQESEAAQRSEKAAIRDGVKLKPEEYREPMRFQAASAGGYGYDKFTAALSGLYIDGFRMSDHTSGRGAPKPPKGRKTYPVRYVPPKGYTVANFVPADRSPDGADGYLSCFRMEGLRFLEARGYRVIQAL
jgi:hypothetical protein